MKGRCRLAATSRPACMGEPVGLCSHCYRVAQGTVKAWQGCGRGSQRRRLNRGAGARASFRAHLSTALPTPAPNHRRCLQRPQRLPVQGHLGAAEAPARHPATGCLGSLCHEPTCAGSGASSEEEPAHSAQRKASLRCGPSGARRNLTGP